MLLSQKPLTRLSLSLEIEYVNNLIQDINDDQEFYNSRVLVLNRFTGILKNFIDIIENKSTRNFEEKQLSGSYSFGSGIAYESSVVKNNPDFRNYISSEEVLKQLKKVFFYHEENYLRKGVTEPKLYDIKQ